MAYYSYVIYNLEHQKFHFGVCTNLEKTEKAHNQGLIKETSDISPWKIVFHEEFVNKEQAIRQVRFYRTKQGYYHLKRRLNF